MANFCKNCGNRVNANDIYCPHCGYKIANNTRGNIIANYDDKAISGLALSFFGLLFCTFFSIIGLIVSIINLQNINNGKISDKNKVIVIAGIAVGALGLFYFLGNIIIHNNAIINNVDSWISNA